MQNDIKEKLKFIYDELDLYKGAIVAGEKVELIITPREENGKYIPNERVITIGLQNGFSRDRVSFVVPNGEYFDDVLLPNILDYYSKNDKYDSDWSISQRTLPLQTNKAILETENGNLLYLETLDDNLFLNLQNRKEREKEEIQTETFSLTMEQLEWQKIIEYAKSRIVPKDAWEDVLSEDERKKIEQVAANPIIFNNKKIVPGIAVKSRKRIIENLEKILNSNEYTEEIEKLGINKGTYDWINSILNENLRSKIKSTIIVKDLAMLLQANNKMQKFITENRDKLSTSIDEFEEKIKFAITELSSKTKYFSNKRNATYQIFINHEQDKDYGNNCPGEIISLRNIYENDVENKIVSEERKTKYIGYCDQLLEYLKNEAYKTYSSRNELDSKINSVSSSLENILDSNQEIAPYSSVNMENRFDQSLNDLLDKIKLVKEARVNEEKFEIIIEKDQNDKKKRLVRVSLTNGMSRNDTYSYVFEDGEKFDKEALEKVIESIEEKDKFSSKAIHTKELSDYPNKVLFTTEEGNEVLMDEDIVNLYYEKKDREKEKNNDNLKQQDVETLKAGATKKLELSKEDRELAEYLRANIFRNNGQLPPTGLRKIEELAENNERVRTLEDARIDLMTGNISKQEYDKIYDKYRAELADAIKNINQEKEVAEVTEDKELKETKTEDIITEVKEPVKRLELSKEDRELADYLRKDILRRRGELPLKGLQEIEELTKKNERAEALEKANNIVAKARKRNIEKEAELENAKRTNNPTQIKLSELEVQLSKIELKRAEKAYEEIHDTYRKQLATAIKKAENSKENELNYNESKKENLNDSYIPGTNIKRPREREIAETDSEYVNYLKDYYSKYFSFNPQTNSYTLKHNGLNKVEENLKNVIARREKILKKINNPLIEKEERKASVEDSKDNTAIYTPQEDLDYRDRYNREMTALMQKLNIVLKKLQEIDERDKRKNTEKYKSLVSERKVLDEQADVISSNFRNKIGITFSKDESKAKEMPSLPEDEKPKKEVIEDKKNLYEKAEENIKKAIEKVIAKEKEKKELRAMAEKEARKIFEATQREEQEKTKSVGRLIDTLKEINKQKEERINGRFELLHKLAEKFRIIHDHKGNIEVVDKESRSEYIPRDDEERREIEFANHWSHSAGVVKLPNETTESVAFNEDSKKLFDVMDVQFKESAKRGIDVDLDSVRREFDETKYDRAPIVYKNLFENENSLNYLNSYYQNQYKEAKSLPNDEVIREEQVKEQTAIERIKEAYSIADNYSKLESPATLKIFFPKEKPETAQITVSYGPTNDEDVLLMEEVSKEQLMSTMLDEICETFIENSGIVNENYVEVPNTNKALLITMGRNDNLFQVSNADKKDVVEFQNGLYRAKEKQSLKTEESKSK